MPFDSAPSYSRPTLSCSHFRLKRGPAWAMSWPATHAKDSRWNSLAEVAWNSRENHLCIRLQNRTEQNVNGFHPAHFSHSCLPAGGLVHARTRRLFSYSVSVRAVCERCDVVPIDVVVREDHLDHSLTHLSKSSRFDSNRELSTLYGLFLNFYTIFVLSLSCCL